MNATAATNTPSRTAWMLTEAPATEAAPQWVQIEAASVPSELAAQLGQGVKGVPFYE